jgi:hypothetical protein
MGPTEGTERDEANENGSSDATGTSEVRCLLISEETLRIWREMGSSDLRRI